MDAIDIFSQSSIDLWLMRFILYSKQIPVNMPVSASTGPVLVRCWQHWPSTGPVLADYGIVYLKQMDPAVINFSQ